MFRAVKHPWLRYGDTGGVNSLFLLVISGKARKINQHLQFACWEVLFSLNNEFTGIKQGFIKQSKRTPSPVYILPMSEVVATFPLWMSLIWNMKQEWNYVNHIYLQDF